MDDFEFPLMEPKRRRGKGGGKAPPVDPWTRMGDLLSGFGAIPSISLPSPSPTTIGYVEGGGGRNPLAILLIVAAAGGAYWWYTKRQKGA